MKNQRPIHYHISLEPDLTTFRFSGKLTLTLEATTPIDRVVLHSVDLMYRSCCLVQENTPNPCAFCLSPADETLEIRLPGPLQGTMELVLDYEGTINDKMVGFYRSRYIRGDHPEWIASTQFQESDARRAFPCMDQPIYKAVFELEMVIDKDLDALSNTVIMEQSETENGKKRVRFSATPKMSTYLLFFAVGRFDFIRDASDPRVRVLTVPGQTPYAESGLDYGVKSLHFCEDYYGIPFPLPKLDHIAIPDFAFGAMENWGAITFRENLLLDYPNITSAEERERIFEVVAHEMAHQWFGNLVTPSDWKFLWLNESFATYFGYGVIDHYYPEWRTWDKFLNGQTGSSMSRDEMHETVAMEIPGGDHVVINASTAPIIYSKGGSILRQIEGYIGSEMFQKGVQTYLHRHAYDCAASHHLWEAFEQASGLPITGIMKSWIEQPGYPIVEVDQSGNQLQLSQKRFTCLPNGFDQVWQIPLTLWIRKQNGDTEIIKKLMTTPTMIMELDPDVTVFKFNAGQSGFYRVRYLQSQSLDAIGQCIRDKSLANSDRWGIQNDLYALVKSGQCAMDRFLDYLEWFDKEDDFLPVIGLANNLYHGWLVSQQPVSKRIMDTAMIILSHALIQIGTEPKPGEAQWVGTMRERLISHLVIYGSDRVTDFAMERFRKIRQGQSIEPNLFRSCLQAGAVNGGPDDLSWFIHRFGKAESEQERQNLLLSMGYFQSTELLNQVLEFTLTQVPQRNRHLPISAMGGNPVASSVLWDWYVDHLDQLEKIHPILYERIIASIVPIHGLGREQEVKSFFDDYIQDHKSVADTAKLCLEMLEINRRIRHGDSEPDKTSKN